MSGVGLNRLLLRKMHCVYCGTLRAWRWVWEDDWRYVTQDNCCTPTAITTPLPTDAHGRPQQN